MLTRQTNENRFKECEELEEGGRHCVRRVTGRNGWYVLYVKVTASANMTIAFWQEIYDSVSWITPSRPLRNVEYLCSAKAQNGIANHSTINSVDIFGKLDRSEKQAVKYF